MKRFLGKNQIIITSLAIMIIIAGYLNFTSDETTPVKQTADEDANIVVDANVMATESELYGDISDEDIAAFPDEDINVSAPAQTDQSELPDGTAIGEAVLTSSSGASAFSASAKLNREQVRSRNEASLLEIIDNQEVSEEMKVQAIANMNQLADRAEKELASELLLEAKGFTDSVVTINDDSVDVIIAAETITEPQKAQIEDIVMRKTESPLSKIVITTMEE